jgi:hypothetical protein
MIERIERCDRLSTPLTMSRSAGSKGSGAVSNAAAAPPGVGGALAQRHARLLAGELAPGQLVQRLDQHREADRSVQVALRDMEADAFGDQAQADHQQEAQAQHDHGRVRVHETGQRLRGEQHHPHRHHHRRHHHPEFVDHADRRDDGVEREHGVERDDLGHDHAEAGVLGRAGARQRHAFDPFVQLHRRLGQQKQAAEQQDQVAPGKRQAADGKQRLGERDDPGDHGQQADAHQHGQRQPEQARAVALFGRELFREDRDEDDVIDPQDDFEDDEGEEAYPDVRVG